MKHLTFYLVLFGFVSLLIVSCNQQLESQATEETSSTIDLGSYELSGATVLAFGPENDLFIGNSKEAKIYAVATTATPLENPVPFNMEGFDILLAKELGIQPREVIINDMKIHPVSQEAYLAVKMGHQPDAKSVITIVDPATGKIRFMEVNEDNSSSISIKNPASDDILFWQETPASALTITDIDYHDGHIYVAGLTNGEFASTIRKVAYPFTDAQESVSSIEIYHAVHTQNETRAPIRTMLFEELNGESTLLASYTCTPLVTIPTSDIKAGASITGKTIAELGYGNAPIDMLVVTTQSFDGTTSKSLIVTNKNRGDFLDTF